MSRYDPTAGSLDYFAGHLNDVTSFRGEPLARAETQTGKDAGVRRALGLMLDTLDEVILEKFPGHIHEQVVGERERKVGIELCSARTPAPHLWNAARLGHG